MAAPPIAERHLPHFHRRAPMKEAVRAATTASITISTALNNGDSLDGLTLATGDRVLVKDQSTDSQNGIYVVGASPARDYDESTDDPAFGYLVFVREGTANGGTLWKNTNTTAPTIGSTSLTFSQFSAGLADPMTTRGDIIIRNASNVTARLAHGSADTYLGSDGTDVSYSAVTDAKLSTSDITTNNASTSKHGFLKKLDNDSTHFMDGTGNWAVPSGSGTGTVTTVEEVDGSPTDSAVTKIVFPNGTLSITSHVATYTPAASGSSWPPLDQYSIDGTYGDHFDGASLSGSWTRRNFTSGAESYQQGPNSTYLRVSLSGRAAGDAYFRTAPAGDWTFAMKFIPRFYDASTTVLFGIAVVDTNGTGVWASYGNLTPNAFDLLALTTYSTYGGSYVEAGLSGASPNTNYFAVDMQRFQTPVYLRLRKSGTNYYFAFSLDGELWGVESAALAWAGTVDRIGMILGPLSGGTLTNAYFDIDWFNKIA